MIDATKHFFICLLLIFPLFAAGQLNAEFTADTTRGCGALGVQFTDQSTGTITSRTWSFGNGNTSNNLNPFENFSTGTYTISLTVSDGSNSDTETKTAYIRVFSKPTADFNFNPSTGCTPLPVNFTSTSTVGGAPIISYIWDVKDGSSSPNSSNFVHTYQGGGPYTPTLQIIDANGCSDSKTSTSSITPTASPVANFSSQASPIGCAAPFTVDFVNTSAGSSLTYRWEFGDGNTSTQQNPTHTYTALGNYTVRLIINDPNCSDTIVKQNFVRINTTNANFTTVRDTFCFGEQVAFTNTSQGANSFSWDFDDGSARSFTRDPKHVFLDSGWFDVTLVASAGSACIDQIIKQVYVQRIVANFDLNPKFSCQLPDTVQFTDLSFGAFAYDWRIPGVNRKFEDSTYVYSIKDPIHIQRDENTFQDTLIIYSEFGCSDTMIQSIRVADTIVTRIRAAGPKGRDDDYGDCLPFTITFSDTTTGPGTIISYEWNLGDGTIFNGQSPPPILYDTAGVYKVTLKVTNDLGCTAIDTSTIYALDKEDPAFVVTPDTVCLGETVTIQMTNSSGNKYNFTIFTANYASGYVEDATNTGYFDTYRDTGYHSVKVKVGDICDTTLILDSAFYVLGPVFNPAYRSGDCNTPRLIEFQGNIYGETRFYWDFGDGSPIDSVNKNPFHTFPRDTVFFVSLSVFNDTNRCPSYIDTIRIDLLPRLPPSKLPFKNYYCRGETVRLYFNNSLLYDSVFWYLNGTYIGDFEDQTFPSSDFNNGFNQVALVGQDIFGCRDTIYDTVFVSNPLARFGSDVQGGCIPFPVQFQDRSISDTTIISWEWILSGGVIDTFTVQNPLKIINSTSPIVVKLSIVDALGCSADTIVDDLIRGGNLNVDFSTTQNTRICVGESIQFFNRSSGTNITSIWDFGDGTIDTLNTPFVSHQFNAAGNFQIKLTVVDQGGCKDSLVRYLINVEANPVAGFTADTTNGSCYPFAVNFSDTSSGNINYWEWNLGSNDSIVFQNPFRNFLDPGNYDIRLIVSTPNGCSDTLVKNDYIQITGPTATFDMSADIICLNEPVTFTITTQNGVGSFRWAFGDGNSSTANPATHIYTDTSGLIKPSLILLDPLANCEIILFDSIIIQDIIAKFSLIDSSGCEPFSPQITNLMQGEDSFVWDLGDGRTSTDRTPDFTYATKGTYNLKLSVNSNIGCSDEAIVPIEVNETPVASINGNGSICFGETTTLNGNGGTRFEWYIGSTLISTTQNITVNPDTTTNYTYIASNQFNCSDTALLEVYVQQAPNYNPIPDSSIIIGEQVAMDASAGLGFIYSWTPSKGLSCTDCPNPIAQPLETTEYILSIRDAQGCFSLMDTILIEVKEVFSLDVPQAFSPNGDGVNDLIYAKGWGLKELIAFKIYNRFGELVFESSEFDKGWDGTYNGKDQMIETYVYTVEAETFKGEVLQKKGNITLLR